MSGEKSEDYKLVQKWVLTRQEVQQAEQCLDCAQRDYENARKRLMRAALELR